VPRGKRKSSKQPAENNVSEQLSLQIANKVEERLDIPTMETWLWDAACKIRGATDAPKFKDFILPLIFYKRLSDVFDDEYEKCAQKFGGGDLALHFIEADHQDALKNNRQPIVRYYIPSEYRWDTIRFHPKDGLGQFVTDAMQEVTKRNPGLSGTLKKDYNEKQHDQRVLDDDRLKDLIEVISRHRLGLKNTNADVLGEAYEYLLRKFAEGQGQSAGEFLTPSEVGWLIAEIIDPEPYTKIYDPTCGSGRLLIKPRLVFNRKHPGEESKAPRLFGQELNPTTFAIAKMNMFLQDFTDSEIEIGDTFRQPKFTVDKKVMRFDYVVANPMWNQDNYGVDAYEADSFKRFKDGIASKSSADWGWVQHIWASLKDNGRAGVVLDTGAVSRGSGSQQTNKERDIRKEFVEKDRIEGVILLPENLFYNTTAPGVVILLNRQKPLERKGEFLLINASDYFVKGDPKNLLTKEGIQAVAEVYYKWETREKLSKIVKLEELREADYNLSPSQFIDINDKVVHRPIKDILADLALTKQEREQADRDLDDVLKKLGFIEDSEGKIFTLEQLFQEAFKKDGSKEVLPLPAQTDLPLLAQTDLPLPAQTGLPLPGQQVLPLPAQTDLPLPAQQVLPLPSNKPEIMGVKIIPSSEQNEFHNSLDALSSDIPIASLRSQQLLDNNDDFSHYRLLPGKD
jgi:type I restriction enzyme M protein